MDNVSLWMWVGKSPGCSLEARLYIAQAVLQHSSDPASGLSIKFPCADLKKFLKKNADGKTLGVADAKLGSIIKEKLGIPCIYR